jgi:GT2 family glycosyltransferase
VCDDLTVVIPTLGRPILEAALVALASGTLWPEELVLVEQGNNPDVDSWVRALRQSGMQVRHQRFAERGRAAGVNRGIERTRTRFVAVTDDDCLVEADWVAAVTERLRATPEAIVTGRVEALGDTVIAAVTSRVPVVYRRRRLRFDAMSGGNMGAAVGVLHRVGPFDEDPCLATAEDCEYSYRALRAGVSIVYAPEVVVRHVGWRDEAERAAQYDRYGRSLGGFLGKYLRRGDWCIGLRTVVHALRAAKRWLRGVVTGDRELARNGRAYLAGLLPGLRAGWFSERPSPGASA